MRGNNDQSLVAVSAIETDFLLLKSAGFPCISSQLRLHFIPILVCADIPNDQSLVAVSAISMSAKIGFLVFSPNDAWGMG